MEYITIAGFNLSMTSSDDFNATDDDVTNDVTQASTSLPLLLLEGVTMFLITFLAIFGNLLVILGVYKKRYLRQKGNVFIVSLAFADLLVAILAMPFNASQVLTGKWPLRQPACDIFNANDVLFSTASILHLCCISIERYIAVVDPFHYHQRLTRRKLATMLFIVWSLSAVISHAPVHTGYYSTPSERYIQTEDPSDPTYGLCLFRVNPVYAIISSSVSFWTPAVIMLGAYAIIFREARKQDLRTEELGLRCKHKAVKTLGIVMGAFLICWTPFFVWYVLTAVLNVCENCEHLGSITTALFWIGYFNSALNPIIYAFLNRKFSRAFRELLGINNIRWASFARSSTSDVISRHDRLRLESNARRNELHTSLVNRLQSVD